MAASSKRFGSQLKGKTSGMRQPVPRGPLSSALIEALAGSPSPVSLPVADPSDPLADDDLHLCLYICYALHTYGIHGVDDSWEWHPSILAFRARLESLFEEALGQGTDTASLPEAGELETWLTGLAREELQER